MIINKDVKNKTGVQGVGGAESVISMNNSKLQMT